MPLTLAQFVKRASAIKLIKAAAEKRLPIPSFADIESSMGTAGNNTPAVVSSEPAFAEPGLRKGKILDGNGTKGSYDTIQALQHAYGDAPKEAVEDLVSRANRIRSGNRQLYRMHNVPTRVPYDFTTDAVDAQVAMHLGLPAGAARFLPDFVLERYSGGDRDVRYATEDVRSKPEQGEVTNTAVVHPTYDTWKYLMRDEGDWRDSYGGKRNRFTRADVRLAASPHSGNGHELTHALNWPYFASGLVPASSESYRGAGFPGQLREVNDTNKEYDAKEMPNSYKKYRSRYNAYSDAEATQSAAQMKRLAYAKFYKDHGRFPRGYTELRNAYRDVTRYKLVKPYSPYNDSSNTNDSSTPIYNPEHARFINEMVPDRVYDIPLEQRQQEYDNNVENWINTMLQKDDNGNFYQDSLVRNNSAMGKIASFFAGKAVRL